MEAYEQADQLIELPKFRVESAASYKFKLFIQLLLINQC